MEYSKQKVHFIGIGEKSMLDLALALVEKGSEVTGSDDAIPDFVRAKLKASGTPLQILGWGISKLTRDIDFIVLGAHIKENNEELLQARAMSLKILSLPEYIYQNSQDKQRIVIAGSYGKTAVAAIVLHVLSYFKRDFDYYIGTPISGLEGTIKLTDDAPIIIIEGDEYRTSAIDASPSFLHYHHHIGLVTGVAWDQMNVYPSYDEYVKQFDHFADSSPKAGILIYSEADPVASMICQKERDDVQRIEYSAHKNEISNGTTYLITADGKVPVRIFGKHNMKNINGARMVCSKIGISDEMFYKAIGSFEGAPDDIEILERADDTIVFQDIASTPSKLKSITNSVRKQYPKRQLVVVLDFKVPGRATKQYLSQYADTLKSADEPVVFYNNNVESGSKSLTLEEIKGALNNKNLKIFVQLDVLEKYLLSQTWKNKNLLLLSSGDFEEINFTEIAKKIIHKDNYQKV